MKNYIAMFEEDYKRVEALYDRWKTAETAEDKAKLQSEMKQVKADIKANGEDYELIYHHYVQAKNRGNRHINFSDVVNPTQTVETLRKFGINIFTFSSRWSGMIDELSEFLEAGCQFCGIAEIFNGCTKFMEDEYETEKAIVFYIK